MSLQVAILADDLSGGNAVGAEFARRGFGTLLLRSAEGKLETDAMPDVLVLDTGTRNLAAEQACAISRRAAEAVRAHAPRFVVKKVDSLLRGPIAAEIDAIADAFGFTRGLVIPASPKAGRTTVEGRQRVGPDPLLSALARFDPSARLATDELPVLLSSCRRPIGRLPLETVSAGREAIAQHLAEIGEGFIIADCETQQDLCAVVEAAAAAGIAYFVGSYGLGEALAGPLLSSRERKPAIAIAGSLSEATRRQVVHLRADSRCHVLALCPDAEDAEITFGDLLDRAQSALARGQDLVLHTRADLDVPSLSDAAEAGESRKRAARVEQLVVSLVEPLLPAISALAISGGATADVILGVLHAHGFVLTEHELMPGIPLARVHGGPWDDLPCVTKPGSFGDDDAIAEILGFFRTHLTFPTEEGKGGFQQSVEERPWKSAAALP